MSNEQLTINNSPIASCILKPGMILRLPYSGLVEVLEVNESRAHVRSLTKEKVKIHSPLNGDAEFTRSGRQWDISPNSEVEVVTYHKPSGQQITNDSEANNQ